MFPKIHTPRRVMMHWDDAGHSGSSPMGNFFCTRCGHRAGWLEASATEMRRGVPCPNCNPTTADKP
jgi:DNA-directed RNA polymerase subunit RPC12/RpoP